MLKLTTIIGDYNRSTIANGATTKAVSVVHNQGDDLTITGFQIVFAANLEKVLCSVYDSQKNRNITSPTTPLGTIGISIADSPPIAPWIKIEPIVLRSGQSIELLVNNLSGNTINVGDLMFSLYGYQIQR
jgi:hypothetical protein